MTKRPRRLLILAGLCLAMASLLAWKALDTSDSIPETINLDSARSSLPTAPPLEASEAIGPQTPSAIRTNLAPREALNKETGPGFHVRGQIVGSTNAPIPAATLTLVGDAHDDRKASESWPSASSDEEGLFQVSPPSKYQSILHILAEGYAERQVPVEWVGDMLDLGVIKLLQSPTLTGRVSDPNGKAIEGARIYALDAFHYNPQNVDRDTARTPLAISDSSGHFRVPGPESQRWALVAEHSMYAMGTASGETVPGETRVADIKIVMPLGERLRGQVHGLPEELCSNFSVSVSNRHLADNFIDSEVDYGSQRVPVDSEGRFLFGGLATGEPVLLSLWSELSKSPTSRRRSPYVLGRPGSSAGEAPDVILPYVTPPTYTARFVDATGTPVEKLTVGTYLADVVMPDGTPGTTDEEGLFPGGVVRFVGQLEEEDEPYSDAVFASTNNSGQEILHGESEEFVVVLGQEHDLGVIQLNRVPAKKAPHTVRIYLQDTKGTPLLKRKFAYQKVGRENFGSTPQETNSKGTSDLNLDPGFDYEVLVLPRHPHHRSLPVSNRKYRSYLGEWTRLPRASKVPGQIVHATVIESQCADVSGSISYAHLPLPRARFTIIHSDAKKFRRRVNPANLSNPKGFETDADGTFLLEGLLPGPWQFWVSHPDLRMPERFDVDLVPGDNQLELTRSQTELHGRVVDSYGRGLAGVPIRALSSTEENAAQYLRQRLDPATTKLPPGAAPRLLALSDIRTTFTDARGDYRLEGVTPGQPVMAVALSPSHMAVQSDSHVIPPFETRQAEDIVLRKGGFLHVTLPSGMRGSYDFEDWIPPGQSAPSEDDPSFTGSILEVQRTQAITPGRWTLHVTWRAIDGRGPHFSHESQVQLIEGRTIPIDLTSITELSEE